MHVGQMQIHLFTTIQLFANVFSLHTLKENPAVGDIFTILGR